MPDQNCCPDCNGEMELGFVPAESYGAVMPVCWQKGSPESKSFLGIKAGLGIKYDPDKMLPITAYRCTDCGLLKFYATRSAST